MNEGVRSYEGPGVAFDWFRSGGPLVENGRLRVSDGCQRGGGGAAYPRPLLADVPTVAAGTGVKLPMADFKGAGQSLGGARLLNLAGHTTAMFQRCAAG